MMADNSGRDLLGFLGIGGVMTFGSIRTLCLPLSTIFGSVTTNLTFLDSGTSPTLGPMSLGGT